MKGLVNARFRAFPSYGVIRGVEQEWVGRRLELRTEGKEVGLSHLVYLQLTFSRHWAAVCGDNKGAMSHIAFGMGHNPLGSLNEQLPSNP